MRQEGPGLVELLASELQACASTVADGVSRRVVLWLDPGREFSRLWPHVSDVLTDRSVQPLVLEPGENQLPLKLEMLRLEAQEGGMAVIYLPGFGPEALRPTDDGTAPELWSIYEYRYKGVLWSLDTQQEPGRIPPPPTLIGWLEHYGIHVVDVSTAGQLIDGGGDSLLSRFAETNRQLPLSRWPSPLKHTEVVAALGGDPRDALRELIAAPTNAVRLWGERAPLVLAGIESAFGLRIPEGEPDAEELADVLVLQLALAEAWEAFGQPDDFPFRTRVPTPPERCERAARFLRADVLPHLELGPRYRERMLRLEQDVDLASWAEDRTGYPVGLPLLARERWRAFLDRLNSAVADDWRRARELLLASADEIATGRSTPWDRVDGDTQWFVLDDARLLSQRCLQAMDQVSGLGRASDLIAAYANEWCEADRLHLQARAACSRVSGLEQLRRMADLAYFEYVDSVNDRFAGLIEDEQRWPPDESESATTLAGVLWEQSSGRRAVLVCDALRWDLAREVADAISGDIRSVLATIPTTTPFGMSALLPLSPEEMVVALEDGVTLRTTEGLNLATREGRKRHLSSRLEGARGGKAEVGFVDMDEVLRGKPLPSSQLVVVLDDTIDAQGHKGTDDLPPLANAIVGKLRRTIERLHEAGIPEVHVVTDHGFLFLPPDMVDGLGRPKVEVRQVLRREPRWCALKPGAPVAGMIRLPLPVGDGSIVLGFPRGVRTLVAADEFLHGGISLQETVIPHIISRVAVEPSPLEVEVSVAVSELVTGTIPVVIRPKPAGLFAQRPVTVRLWVESVAEPGSTPVTEPVEVEVRAEASELKPPLYLREGAGLAAGSGLVLRAVDVESGRELAGARMVLAVDWD